MMLLSIIQKYCFLSFDPLFISSLSRPLTKVSKTCQTCFKHIINFLNTQLVISIIVEKFKYESLLVPKLIPNKQTQPNVKFSKVNLIFISSYHFH